jgi:hypothetical protein
MEADTPTTVDPVTADQPTNSLSAGHLLSRCYWLWISPNRFFRSIDTRQTTISVLLCVYLMGITAVADRIDSQLLKYERLGTGNDLLMTLTQSWPAYWGFVLLLGILGAVFAWFFWGWIFNLRVWWSGDEQVDPRQGRNVYSVMSLVSGLPYLVVMVVPVFFYPDYLTYYYHEELWSSLLVVFILWGHVTQFIAVKGQFNVVTWKAAIWFLILPIGLMALVTYLYLFAL